MATGGSVGNIFVRVGLDPRDFQRGIRDIEGSNSRLSKSFANLGRLAAGYFAFDTIRRGVGSVIQTNRKFEKSLSSLSAITGATGKDLEFYSQQAKDIGLSTTLGATGAVKAFEIIGSKRPELLKTKEALAAVARETVTLAEASGLELEPAATALTGALNQFNLASSESNRVINALAAGSKEGAVAIPPLTDALLRFGTVAATANIGLEESIALVELLGEKGIETQRAGTSLRNILTILQEGADRFNPAVVGLTTALENLAAEQLDTAQLAKLFGKENLVSAQILVQNVPKIQKFTDAVTGTNTAMEQAKVQTANLDGAISRFDNTVEALSLSFNGEGGLTKAVRGFVDAGTSLVQLLVDLNSNPVDRLIESKDIPSATRNLQIFRKALEDAKESGSDLTEVILENGTKGALSAEQLTEALTKQRQIIWDLAQARQSEKNATEESNDEAEQGIPILQGLRGKLEELQTARENAFSTDAIAAFNAQIRETEKAIEAAQSAFKFDFSPVDAIQTVGVGFDDTALRDAAKNDIPFGGKITGGFDTFSIASEFENITAAAKLFGDVTGGVGAQISLLQSEILNLLDAGLSPADAQIQALKERLDELTSPLQSLKLGFATMGEQIKNTFLQGEQGIESFGKVLANAARQNIKVAIAEGVSQAVAKALAGVPFPFNIAAGGVAAGAALALFNTVVPAFRTGGPTGGNTWGLVGETGPEIVRFGSGSNITPNNQIGSLFDNPGGTQRFEFEPVVVNGGDLLFVVEKAKKNEGRRS